MYDQNETKSPMAFLAGEPLMPQSVPMLVQLSRRKIRLEDQLRDINNAIQALEANPGVEAVLDAINKAGRY